MVAAAQAAGAHEFITKLADGYDTVVGERGYTLSGGQRQRIAIARTLLVNPPILVLDDATSAIDVQVEQRIHAGLRVQMEGRTTLIIAHRLSTICLADRVVLLDQHRIVADGTHAELLGDHAALRRGAGPGRRVRTGGRAAEDRLGLEASTATPPTPAVAVTSTGGPWCRRPAPARPARLGARRGPVLMFGGGMGGPGGPGGSGDRPRRACPSPASPPSSRTAWTSCWPPSPSTPSPTSDSPRTGPRPT